MPIECAQLELAPTPLEYCPKCGVRFAPFLRGTVHRSFWEAPFHWIRCWLRGDRFQYVALICYECKEIVGYEHPDDYRH